jgi:hypothetical protein
MGRSEGHIRVINLPRLSLDLFDYKSSGHYILKHWIM